MWANTAQNLMIECRLYSQATHLSNLSVAPTRIDAQAWMNTAAAVQTFLSLTYLISATATAMVTGTPNVSTVLGVIHPGVIQQPTDASTSAINIMIMVSQAAAADVVVVKAGSCRVW
jgi:hypothetical protein